MELNPATVTAIATIIGALISGAVSLLVSSKQYDKSMVLVEYQIAELKRTVEKHNHLVERTAIVERDLKTCFNRYDEIRAELKEVKK